MCVLCVVCVCLSCVLCMCVCCGCGDDGVGGGVVWYGPWWYLQVMAGVKGKPVVYCVGRIKCSVQHKVAMRALADD